MQSALERIARARAKGKTNVNLTAEEMEALERRRGGQPPEPTPPSLPALVSPPATPARTPKGKGSRSSSATSLASQKTKKKSSLSSPSPAKSNSKAKVDRKASAEQSPYAGGPPGIMVPGPNGVPVFAPLVNYPPPPSPEFARTRSRSTSKHSRRDSTPPERTDPYGQYAQRYYVPQTAGVRPPSSGSNRSLPDDADWYPSPPTRPRGASNAAYAGYRTAADDYEVPTPPAAQGRRNVSGPADVRYASLRRVPPSSSPLAPARPGAPQQHAYSDPAVAARKGSLLGQELERTSSSSSDDQGVQVNIVPDGSGAGYSINRAPVAATVSSSAGRRRKSGRR